VKTPLHRTARNGFTIVELLAGFIAAAIVAVTAGLVLYFIQRGAGDNQAAVGEHQDGSVAMAAISRALRDSVQTNTDLTVQEQIRTTNASGERLLYVDAVSRRLYCTLENGTPIALTERRVAPAGFSFSNVANGIAVRLVLEGAEGPMSRETVVHFRNP
jgi:type II secretory pathway pseudopilin PulG